MRQMPNVAARFARLRLAPLKLDLLSISLSIFQSKGDFVLRNGCFSLDLRYDGRQSDDKGRTFINLALNRNIPP